MSTGCEHGHELASYSPACLECFIGSKGRWPSAASADPLEQKLGEWVMRLRSHVREPNVDSSAILSHMELIPGWTPYDLEPCAPIIQELSAQVADGQPADSPGIIDSMMERWLAAASPPTPIERKTTMEHVVENAKPLPSQGKLDAWLERLGEVSAYASEHGKPPSSSSKDEEAKRLGQWVAAQRTKINKGGLHEDQLDLLRDLPGWVDPKPRKAKQAAADEFDVPPATNSPEASPEQQSDQDLSADCDEVFDRNVEFMFAWLDSAEKLPDPSSTDHLEVAMAAILSDVKGKSQSLSRDHLVKLVDFLLPA